MRLPAQRSLQQQAAYPSQAEGGFAGDLHSSVTAALRAWEKKRAGGAEFRYGRTGSARFTREKTTATRDEISWNAAPQSTAEPKRKSKTVSGAGSKKRFTAEEQAAKQREYARRYRDKIRADPEAHAAFLAKIKETRLKKLGRPQLRRSPSTDPEVQRQRKNEINARYRANKKTKAKLKK